MTAAETRTARRRRFAPALVVAAALSGLLAPAPNAKAGTFIADMTPDPGRGCGLFFGAGACVERPADTKGWSLANASEKTITMPNTGAAIGTTVTLQYTTPPGGPTLARYTLTGAASSGNGQDDTGNLELLAGNVVSLSVTDGSLAGVRLWCRVTGTSGTTIPHTAPAGCATIHGNTNNALILPGQPVLWKPPQTISPGTLPALSGTTYTGARILAVQLSCSAAPTGVCEGRSAPHTDTRGSSTAYATLMSFTLGIATLTFEDIEAPRAISAIGTLIAGGPVRGIADATVAVSDTGGGVQAYRTRTDAGDWSEWQLASDNNGNCAVPLAADQAIPCAQEVPLPVSIDTTLLGDGEHTIQMQARDAGGNVTDVLNRPFLVDNIPDPAPGASGDPTPVPPNNPNGANPSRKATISLTFAKTKKQTLTVAGGSKVKVTGRLRNQSGDPVTGATIAITGRPAVAGAASRQLGTATTARDGSFSHMTAATSSMKLTASYTAYSAEGVTARKTLQVNVPATIGLRATPRVSTHKPLRITGRVASAPKGVVVVIQALDGRHWRNVADTKTKRGGTFAWRYRFKPASRGRTFYFRAKVDDRTFPYSQGYSGPARVRVR